MSSDQHARERVDRFMSRVFAQGEIYKTAFDELCRDGFPRDELSELLFGTCTIAKFRIRRVTDFDAYPGISESGIKKLPDELRGLATFVKSVNKTFLNPKKGFRPIQGKEAGFDVLISMFEMLPGLMHTYSFAFEKHLEFVGKQLRRMTITHLLVRSMLLSIRQHTGSWHYRQVEDLLVAGFRAASGKLKDPPTFFTAEAMAKLMQRHP